MRFQREKASFDFRLLLFGIGIWLGSLLAHQFSWPSAVLLLIALIFAIKLRPRLAILVWAVLLGCCIYTLHYATLQSSVLAKLAQQGELAKVIATVTSDPKISEPKVNGSLLREPRTSFLVRANWVDAGEIQYQLRLPARVLLRDQVPIKPGDQVEFFGRPIVTREKRVAATFVVDGQLQVIKPAGSFSSFLSGVRADFRDSAYRINSTAATLIPGMILGDTSLQSPEFSRQMRRAGLSHLTAVSGANFAIVSALVFALVRLITYRVALQVFITATALSIFLLLVRPTPSVLRAGVMAAVILIARASGSRSNASAALAGAITLLLLLDPFQAHDPGFVLSVLATSGLIFISPALKQRLTRFMPDWLAEVVAISTAATVLCTPYIMFLAGEISALSILFNIAVAPLIAPITIAGFVAVITLPLNLLSNMLLYFAEFGARWIVYVAGFSSSTPSWQLSPVFILFLILVAIYLRRRASKLLFAAVFALMIVNLYPKAAFPGKDWLVVQCDVGQGDALVLNLGDGSGVLFDVGPDPVLIDRCLKVIGIKELPLIVLSHNHADHTFGLLGATKNRNVGEIWSNGNVLIPEGFAARTVSQGDIATLSDYRFTLLWPIDSSSDINFAQLPGDGSLENNSSLVVLVEKQVEKLAGFSLLVTGDIEPEAQAQIAAMPELGEVNVLKVAHHGSKFQDDAFLSQAKPDLAVVSVGKANTYGHPDPGTLAKLVNLGAKIYRTDLDGPISVSARFDEKVNRYIFTTRIMRKEWWRIQWR